VIRMSTTMTKAQEQRLYELGADLDVVCRDHDSSDQRDARFAEIETRLMSQNRTKVSNMMENPRRNQVRRLESSMAEELVARGFQEVSTPHMITRDALARMGIEEGDPLFDKVFWLDTRRCLRPMLAPGLYSMMRTLRRSYRGPLRLFEVGPCYRKESHGNKHLEQFTMLNLVEVSPAAGTPRLKEIIGDLMGALDINYELSEETSEVYGTTVDIMVNGIEVASCATGPHKLDKAHGINEPWAGVGLGLERLILATRGEVNIKRVGGSLVYLEGVRVDL
jgi:phenylalanyl-tRNA synthetase alpha chain